MCWYKIEWFKASKYINIIIERLYGKTFKVRPFTVHDVLNPPGWEDESSMA